MQYALTFAAGLVVTFGVGLGIGYSTLDIASTQSSQVASLVCYGYDEYGNELCEYQDDEWYAFPEDQGAAPPPQEEWYWTSEAPVEVMEPEDRGWYFNGHYDSQGSLYEPEYLVADPYEQYYYESETDPWVVVEPYDMYEEGMFSLSPASSDLWIDDYEYWDEPAYIVVEEPDPWYVEAFPGFGKLAQQLIPGQQTSRPVLQPIPARPQTPPPPPPRYTYPQPSCWISAQPMQVKHGGSTTLSWSSFNAAQASISGIGNVPTSGSRTVPNITSTRIFSLSVTGQGGTGACYTRVEPIQAVLPTCIISVNPNVITRGERANLAWGSSDAVSATLSGVGTVATHGGRAVQPQQSTTYTLTVSNAAGPKTCSAYLNVR